MVYSLRYYLFLIIAIGILSASFHGMGLVKGAPIQIFYSDAAGFFQKAIESGFPYLTKKIEYPVLTGLFIHLMGQLGGSEQGYYLASAIFLILFAVGATYFLYRSLEEKDRKRLIYFWIAAPSMLVFLTYNWDIIALFFVAIAFYFFRKDKDLSAAAFLALGASAKFYPGLYLAPLLIKQKNWPERFKIAGVFGAVAGLINLPFIISNFSGWAYFFTLNSSRNSNPDSIWTIARFFFRGLTIPEINYISLTLFLSAAGFLLWKFRRESFLKLCFGLTVLFLLFNKVFTPQYLMWLLPFFVLLPELKAKEFYLLEFSNLAVFFSILPWFFLGHDMFYFYLTTPFILIRHILLLIILFKTFATRKQPVFAVSEF